MIFTISNSCFLCEYVLNCNLFLYFQHHYSSLQCHMIFRNHNNIKKHFWLLSVLKTVVLHNIFVETVTLFIFSGLFDEWKVQKNPFYLNMINIRTVTFDKCNVSLMNKICMHNFKKSLQHHTSIVHYVKYDFYFCPLLIQMDVFHKVKSLFPLVSETSGTQQTLLMWLCFSGASMWSELLPLCFWYSFLMNSVFLSKAEEEEPPAWPLRDALRSSSAQWRMFCSTSNQPAAKAASHTAIMNLVEP